MAILNILYILYILQISCLIPNKIDYFFYHVFTDYSIGSGIYDVSDFPGQSKKISEIRGVDDFYNGWKNPMKYAK